MAKDCKFTPASSNRLLPSWNPFSITIPIPDKLAFACSTKSLRPRAALPLA